jgi:hypothetical protein
LPETIARESLYAFDEPTVMPAKKDLPLAQQ